MRATVSRSRTTQASLGGPMNWTSASVSSRSGASFPASERGGALGVGRDEKKVSPVIRRRRLGRRQDAGSHTGQEAGGDDQRDDARDDYSSPFHAGERLF